MASLEQFGMRSGPHENNLFVLAAPVDSVEEKEVSADVAFPVICQVAGEGMIQPFRPKRPIAADEDQHGLFEPPHVISAGAGQPHPVLDERFCMIRRPREGRAFTACRLLRGHGGFRRVKRSGRVR